MYVFVTIRTVICTFFHIIASGTRRIACAPGFASSHANRTTYETTCRHPAAAAPDIRLPPCRGQQPPPDIQPRRHLQQRRTVARTGQVRIPLGRDLRRAEHVGRRADAALPERLAKARRALGKPDRTDRRHARFALLDPHQLRTRPLRPGRQERRTAPPVSGNVQDRMPHEPRSPRPDTGSPRMELRPPHPGIRKYRIPLRHRVRQCAGHALRHRLQPLDLHPRGRAPHPRHVPGERNARIRGGRHPAPRSPDPVRLRRRGAHLPDRRPADAFRGRDLRITAPLRHGTPEGTCRPRKRLEHHSRRRRLPHLVLHRRGPPPAADAPDAGRLRHRADRHPGRHLFAAPGRPAGDRMDRKRRTGALPADAQRRGVPLDHLQQPPLPPLETRTGPGGRRRRGPLDRDKGRRDPPHPRLLPPEGVQPAEHPADHHGKQRAARQFGLRLCAQPPRRTVDRKRRRRAELLLLPRPHHTPDPVARPRGTEIHSRTVRIRPLDAVGRHGRMRGLPGRTRGRRRPAADPGRRTPAFQR